MSDNVDTPDNIINDLPTTEHEKVADEIIPANKQENLTQIQDSENMEVHHHAGPHHESKNGRNILLNSL